MKDTIKLEVEYGIDGFNFNTLILDEIESTKVVLDDLSESIDSIVKMKPECDRVDYSLAISAAAISGIIDVFLVNVPNESILQSTVDRWAEERTKDFARLFNWDDTKGDSLSSAIRFLEEKFKIPYDQRGAGDAGSVIPDLNPTNHHIKSLGHNPSIVGLFFSILDQFRNQSHFVSGGNLIDIQKATESYVLVGSNVASKIYSGFVNWVGHLMSDFSGASSSKGRGMGIPSPLWTWTNDVIVIKSKLNIPRSTFDHNVNELAMEIFNKGFDLRFQGVQAIPVIVNELLVRFFYSLRRSIQYYKVTEIESINFKSFWVFVEPFSNPTVERMLTTTHGFFCLIDFGDATLRSIDVPSSSINPMKFLLRLNVVGVGRFTISLYGEVNRAITYMDPQRLRMLSRERRTVSTYLESLQELSRVYDDNELRQLVSEFSESDMYREVFEASITLSDKRNVPDDLILRSKKDGDDFFRKANNEKR